MTQFTKEENEILKEFSKTGKIKTKEIFYTLYNKGLLGNRPKIWKNIEKIHKSNWEKKYTIRIAVPGHKGIYNIPKEQLQEKINELKLQGIKEEHISFNQSMPDYKIKIQGEIMEITEEESKGFPPGIYLTYNTIKKAMKEGFEEETLHAKDNEVIELLKKHLSPNSQLEIQNLINNFPNHAIEFSAYEMHIGDLPQRNTIIWEVRAY
ncbi:hypothetical protein KAT36_03100 [Candidatus Pacearchaeota archaeon]|nr:hypothetical protein [Candidatus Pacearchaeota archaeon]